MGNLTLDMKLGDLNPEFRTPIIGDDGVSVVNLTGATARLRALRPDNTVLDKALTIEAPATNGIVSYSWAVGDLPTLGDYYFIVRVTYADGSPQTFPARGVGIISVNDEFK